MARKVARWETYDEWYNDGIERRYDNKNSTSLMRSHNKEERSWYGKGKNMNKNEGWLKKFPFNRKKIDGRWETYRVWKDYGMERGYNKRNSSSLLNSENKEEVSWCWRAYTMKKERWSQKFPFNRERRPKGFFTEKNDDELLKYALSRYGRNITRKELFKLDQGLFGTLYKRSLLKKIKTKNGKEYRPKGFFSNKSDKELLNYLFSKFNKKITRKELRSKDSLLCIELSKRKLIDII